MGAPGLKVTSVTVRVPPPLPLRRLLVKCSQIARDVFEYQIYTFFKEYFSVLIIPYTLLVLSNYVENILDVILNNLEYDNTLGYIDKNSNFRSLNEKSNDKKVISFSEFRIKYPDWGTNIELYQLGDNSKLINREENLNLKMHTTYDSNISII